MSHPPEPDPFAIRKSTADCERRAYDMAKRFIAAVDAAHEFERVKATLPLEQRQRRLAEGATELAQAVHDSVIAFHQLGESWWRHALYRMRTHPPAQG
jgi:hypothetical protein